MIVPRQEPSRKDRLIQRFTTMSAAAGVLVFAVGVAVLIGWAFDVMPLKTVVPGLVAMKANTAICFGLLGLSLGLFQAKQFMKNSPLVARACSFAVLLIAGMTLFEYISGIPLGIDQLFFKEAAGAALTTHPGRMAVNTAICFILASAALFLLHRKNKQGRHPEQSLAILGLAISFLSLIGYSYGVNFLYYGVNGFTAMALHAAIAFCVFFLGILFSCPQQGMTRIFTDTGMAGTIARRLLPITITISPILGWVNLWGRKAGVFSDALGGSILATLDVTIISSCVIWLVIFIKRTEDRRLLAETASQDEENKFHILFETANDAVFVHRVNPDGTPTHFLEVNQAACQRLGYTRDELLTLSPVQIDDSTMAERRQAAVKSLTEEGGSLFEMLHVAKDGRRIPVEISSRLFTYKGETRVLSMARDLTERKTTESLILKEAQIQADLLDNLPCIAMVLKKGTREIVASNKVAREIGAIPGKKCYEVCAERDDHCPFCLAPKLWQTNEPQRVEARYRGKYYEGIWAPLTAELYVHYIFDITERKIAEEALKESLLENRSLFENLQSGFAYHRVILDDMNKPVDYVFLEINKAFEKHTGLTRAIIGKNVTGVHPGIENENPNFIDIYGKVALTGQVAKFDAYFRPQKHWYSISAYSPKKGYFVTVFDDITERKQAEDALRENKKQLDLALRNAGMGMWQWDIPEDKRSFDEQVCRVLGIDPKTFNGNAEEFFNVIHPEDREPVRTALKNTLEQDVPYEPAYRVIWPDGSVHHIMSRGSLFRDDHGQPIRLSGLLWDSSEQKAAQAEAEKRAKELEIFYKVSMGREDRILELKNQIKKLEEEIKNR